MTNPQAVRPSLMRWRLYLGLGLSLLSNAQPADNPALGVDPKTFAIGPSDTIRVEVFNSEPFTRSLVVRPDGRITLPMLGDMQAAGLTPERLGSQIQEALRQYLVNPSVTVYVLQVNSRTYMIAGQVGHPGTFPLLKPTKVFDALNMAGSFLQFANRSRIVISRGDKRIPFNYNDVLKGKNLQQNIELEPGDTIIVN